MKNNLDTKKEIELSERSYKSICGIDEVGLGPWAGPLTFGAVIYSEKLKEIQLKDSKLLSPKKREDIFSCIKKNGMPWSIGAVSNDEIDSYGLTKAKQIAIIRTLDNLPVKPDYLLFDGVSFFRNSSQRPVQLNLPSEFIIKGDNRIKSIAAASIVAKVSRDKKMEEYHNEYPNYHFDKNKGYGTREHREALEKYGACPLHRKSYKPVQEYL